jgi:hypothetical protein
VGPSAPAQKPHFACSIVWSAIPGLDLRGQTRCFVDVRSSGGFSMPPTDGVLFYAVVQGSVQIAGITGGFACRQIDVLRPACPAALVESGRGGHSGMGTRGVVHDVSHFYRWAVGVSCPGVSSRRA